MNVDPYITEVCTGRIRHVYVLKRARRQGVATTLMRYLLNYVRRSFRSVRLFTDTKGGAMSYEALGFNPSYHLPLRMRSRCNKRGMQHGTQGESIQH